MKRYDINQIQQLVNDGWLNEQSHPTLPLKIYKYSLETQYSNKWDEITINSRGLVLDEFGVSWNNPIPKFFNLEQLSMVNLTLPELPYQVFDKVDGSCVQIFRYFDEIIVTTLGSFQSDQSKIAEKLLYSKYSDSLKYIEPGFTYIFELVVPENRIVLNYGDDEKLVLLTVRDNDDDQEFLPKSIGFPVVDELKLSIEQLMIEKSRPDFVNKEGFVIRFSNGFRVKIKYDEYFRLHKVMTGVNEKFVWENMKDGKEIPLDGVPDEFFQYVDGIRKDLLRQYVEIDVKVTEIFNQLFVVGESRKDFAMKAIQSQYKSILFKLYEGKPYDQIIWDMIEPKFVKSNFQSLRMEDDN